MITISAFADEISDDLQAQMDGCEQCGVMCIDVRRIDNKNVSALTCDEARHYRRQMDDRGFTVPCIGSPIGKIRLNEDFDAHLDLLKHCFEIAHLFGTRRIRIFSFYAEDEHKPVTDSRDNVMERMADMVSAAEAADMELFHENEKRIYGAKPEGVLDLLSQFPSRHFKAIFDPANFVEEGIRPVDDGWKRGLDRRTDFFHIKDKVRDAKSCVPAGEGDGQFAELFDDLARIDWSGYMTLEPHMKTAEQFQGFSGPENFRKAAGALQAICRKAGLPYR